LAAFWVGLDAMAKAFWVTSGGGDRCINIRPLILKDCPAVSSFRLDQSQWRCISTNSSALLPVLWWRQKCFCVLFIYIFIYISFPSSTHYNGPDMEKQMIDLWPFWFEANQSWISARAGSNGWPRSKIFLRPLSVVAKSLINCSNAQLNRKIIRICAWYITWFSLNINFVGFSISYRS